MRNDFIIKGEITEIIIKNKNGANLIAIIDTDDLSLVQSVPNSWISFTIKHSDKTYIKTFNNQLLHRLIMGNPKGKIIDHINHNTFDNRKSCNLRILTNAENMQNRSGISANNTSGARGVSWDKRLKKWEVRVIANKKKIYIGIYSDLNEATNAAIEARKKHMKYASG